MSANQEQKNIYKKLREFRRSRGLSTNTLAEKISENPQKISRIERGARNLTVDYLMKVAKALETPLNVLLEENTGSQSTTNELSSNLLHDVILFVEQNMISLNSLQKSQAISKVYEQALKFPASHQTLFLSSLADLMKLALPSKSDK